MFMRFKTYDNDGKFLRVTFADLIEYECTAENKVSVCKRTYGPEPVELKPINAELIIWREGYDRPLLKLRYIAGYVVDRNEFTDFIGGDYD